MDVDLFLNVEKPAADQTTDSNIVEAELKGTKTIRKLEYECLCSQHNPVCVSLIYFNTFDSHVLTIYDVTATKRANRLDRVRENLLSLPPISRVKLRVTSGTSRVFEVLLLAIHDDRNTVEALWDVGTKMEFEE